MAEKGVFVKTFGCVQNTADSERIKYYYWKKGYRLVSSWEEANVVVINTCVIRESAENRAYGLINKIDLFNSSTRFKKKIVITGCLVGALVNQKNLHLWKRKFPMVQQWLPIQTFDYGNNEPLRAKVQTAIIPISSGCNNYCSYCIVPFTRGKEISRPFDQIIDEAMEAKNNGFEEVLLVGQNVNSYGADFSQTDNWVNLGKKRFKSLFPKLLAQISELGFKNVEFVSSNPWDFSDELIEVIASHGNVSRTIHLPLQSGDDQVLKRMNRGYSARDYLELATRIKKKVKDVRITTDIIVGFPGEDELAFGNTVKLCQKIGFVKAYINKYSPRRGTISAKLYKNDVSPAEKKKRWMKLEKLINA